MEYGFWRGEKKVTACHGNSGITAGSDWTILMASDADTYYYSVCIVEQVTVNHPVGGSSPSRGAILRHLLIAPKICCPIDSSLSHSLALTLRFFSKNCSHQARNSYGNNCPSAKGFGEGERHTQPTFWKLAPAANA